MKKEDYLSELVTLRAICLTNLAELQSKSKEDTTSSKKDKDSARAQKLASIIKRLGACISGTRATVDLVSELTGLNVTYEMVYQDEYNSSAFTKSMSKLTMYIPKQSGMDLAKDVPCLYMTGQKFLTVACSTKSAYHPSEDKLRLASSKEIDLFFKAVEVQVEFGKGLSKTMLKAIADHSK